MSHKCLKLTAIFGLLGLVGCGSDREADMQREELRQKVVQLDVEMRELKNAHQAELDALKKVVDQQSEQLLKVQSNSAKSTGAQIPNRSPEPLEPSFTSQQILTREAMQAEAQKKMELQRSSRDGAKSVAIIRQLYSNHTAGEVANLLNEKHISNHIGGFWTTEDVEKVVNDNHIDKVIAP